MLFAGFAFTFHFGYILIIESLADEIRDTGFTFHFGYILILKMSMSLKP